MSSLIVKICKDGLIKEFYTKSFGPIFISKDENKEFYLNSDKGISFLEIKLSGGEVFIKDISQKSEVLLNSKNIEEGEFTDYIEAQCISLMGENTQIYLSFDHLEDKNPPPFFEDEFQERLSRMDRNIIEKEKGIKSLDQKYEKKVNQLQELENRVHKHLLEKNKLELELSSLASQKSNINKEIAQKNKLNKNEEDKCAHLEKVLKQLNFEEKNLIDKIDANNIALEKLKHDKEFKSKEVGEQRTLSIQVQKEVSMLKETLLDLNDKIFKQTNEIKNEDVKYKNILIQTNLAHKEESRLKSEVLKIGREKALLSQEQTELSNELSTLHEKKMLAQNNLQEVISKIDFENSKITRIQEEILRHHEDQENLAFNCQELRGELTNLQDKLTAKRNEYNQTEFDHQEQLRKISSINFQIEQLSTRLTEHQKEEKVQELKVISMREDIQNKAKQFESQKEQIQKDLNSFIDQTQLQKKSLQSEIDILNKQITNLEIEKEKVQQKAFAFEVDLKNIHKDKTTLELELNDLKSKKENLISHIQNLSKESFELERQRNQYRTELNQSKIQIQQIQAQIKDMETASKLDLEQFKREERLKIISEKGISLAEIEAERQKSLINIQNDFKLKQEQSQKMTEIASEQASLIIQDARNQEVAITKEAQRRLNEITNELSLREEDTHKRVKEANNFVKEKEEEASKILASAKIEAHNYVEKIAHDFQEDINIQKKKVKEYLAVKQHAGEVHIKALQEQYILKQQKQDEYHLEKLELLKRKELKKIAKIRESEFAKEADLKESFKQEYKAMKDKALLELSEIREKQLEELAQKKKATIDHINSLKIDATNKLESELSHERSLINKSKKDRLANATQAVVNILRFDNKISQEENEADLRQKILTALEKTIDGQNANAFSSFSQVLDINPAKKKHFFPVIKKYTVQVGIPAAIAIVLMADIGQVRTMASNQIENFLKAKNSASQIYVKKQQEDWKEKHTFSPELSIGYKSSFTDNVIYTKDFIQTIEDEKFQNNWILKVHDYLVKDLELSEDMAINYISSEGALIKELSEIRKELHPQFLNQGIEKMKSLEETQLGWLKEKITNPETLEKFSNFRKEYFDSYYTNNRLPAQEKAATSISE